MEQFDAFKKYVSAFLSIPPLEWLHMVRLLRMRHVKKGEFYFRQGEKFDEVGFVVKGLFYHFYSLSDGNIYVKNFISESQPVTCYANLIQNTPADFACEALEDTTLITIRYADLKALYQRHNCWERMGRVSAEKLFIEREQRQLTHLTMTATERYEHFVKTFPHLLDRVPQYLIASYLGITPISLSRIRSKT